MGHIEEQPIIPNQHVDALTLPQPLSLTDAMDAAVFGPELCQPVAQFIHAFNTKLPANDILITMSDFFQSTLIPSRSPRLHYYTDMLMRTYNQLQTIPGIHQEKLTAAFTSAFLFFQNQQLLDNDIRINCLDLPASHSEPAKVPLATFAVLDNKTLAHSLLNHYTLDANRIQQSHMVVISRINAQQPLVIAIGTDMENKSALIQNSHVLDELLHRRDDIRLTIAIDSDSETEKENAKALELPLFKDLMTRIHDLWHNDLPLQTILHHLLSSKNANLFCGLLNDALAQDDTDLCRANLFPTTMLYSLYYSLYSQSPDDYLLLTNNGNSGYLDIFRDYQDADTPGKQFNQRQRLHHFVIQKGKDMSTTLATHINQLKDGSKHQIILLIVGVNLLPRILKKIGNNTKASMIGLIPEAITEPFLYFPHESSWNTQ